MTPTNGSVPPTYVAALPKLERMHFVEADLPAAMLAPFNDSVSLRRIVFEDCSHNRRLGVEQGVLRDGIEVRMVTRMIN